MKRLLAAAGLALLLTGCIAHMTPYGVSIEPLADFFLVGPPVVVEAPPAYRPQPLPPVVVVPDRSVYFYGSNYYYYWGDSWYWSRQQRGPWHPLQRNYYPSRVERRDDRRGHDDRGRGGGLERR